MSERYTHQLLKVVVAQICQTIGWHSIQSTPMELMIDILDQYLRDITRVTHRYAELYNRTDPNLDDVALAYREMGMNLNELQEYLQYVDPIERPFEVPKYPLPKESHLNFLKPGSKEVLSRPVHIPEHMPPMLVDSEEEQEEEERRRQMQMQLMAAEASEEAIEDVKPDLSEVVVEKMEEVGAEEVAVMDASQSEEMTTFKRPLDGPISDVGLDVKKPKTLSDERRPTREISSVIMTTSGFISPAREGRLPDSKPPVIPEEKPKPPPPPPPAPVSSALPVAKIDEKFSKKAKKKPIEKEKKEKKDKKLDKKKESSDKEKEAAKSRPATPTIPTKEQVEAPPLPTIPTPAIPEDIKPPPMMPVELPPKPPTPVPDVKPTLPLPSEPEKVHIPPPIIPVAPLPKPKKEKAPRKKKQQEPKLKSPLPPPMIPNPGMDIGAIFPPNQAALPPSSIPSPLINQITPPKPPKPKRTKLTKKQIERQYMEQLQQFQGPLNAQNILDMFTPPSGKKPLPGLFQSPLFPPQKQAPPPPQQQAQPPKFPDNVAQSQLDMLQKLHPSLEITPAPGPSSIPPSMHASPEKHKLNIFKKVAKKEPPPGATTQGPIIVIDDDKSPPHQPQFPMTPMSKKRAPKASSSGFSFQDTLSSPDMGFNMSMTPSDHSGGMGPSAGSFREFSPPKTPSNLPKTPDIKMPSSSSSSASWMSDSGKLSTGPSPLFGDFPNFGLPPAKEEKKKKPRQPKQPKETAAAKKAKSAGLLEEIKLLQQFQQQLSPAAPGPSHLDKKPIPQDVMSNYTKLLNPAMPPGFLASQMRNPGMFGMFPLPSGPGLIPDNPLFPFNPAQSFLPTGPFGMPPLPPRFDINKLLQNPRPSKATPMENFDNLDPETKLAHTPLDLQKSNCNVAPLVPPSLQIDPVPPPLGGNSRKKTQVSPAVKELKDLHPQEQSLNLSIKSNIIHFQNPTIPSSVVSQPPAAHQQPKFSLDSSNIYPKDSPVSTSAVAATTPTTMVPSHQNAPPPPSTPVAPPNQNLPTLAAASPTVPPITPGETIVIETDSDTNSQSTVTMAAMGVSPPQSSGGSTSNRPPKDKDKSEKRKSKEHKKDKKLKEGKEGKIKKKKDKKDKNKSKDRDRDRPKSSHSMVHDLSDGTVEPSFAAGGPSATALDDPMLLEQIRRKEKKEKKKEKLKKEKRKEKERAAAAAAAMDTSFPDARGSSFIGSVGGGDLFPSGGPQISLSEQHRNSPDVGASGGSVPKLMLKLGSTSTPSPRSGTPDTHPSEPSSSKATVEVKREASPELARISALVTRPPKLKTPGSKGKSKEDDTGKAPKLSVDHSSKAAGKLDFSGTDQPSKPRPRGIQALPDSIDLFSVTPTPAHPKASAASLGPSTSSEHTSKKPPKESKSSKSSSASASLGVTIPAPLNTPINVQDADGNVVWICPACGRVDDGTPMIGCDGCDAWYHWVCVGIQVPPDSNEDWYCRVCIGKKQESHGDEKQKKRKKKDKKNPKD